MLVFPCLRPRWLFPCWGSAGLLPSGFRSQSSWRSVLSSLSSLIRCKSKSILFVQFLKEMEQTAIKTTPAESVARRNALEAAASGSSNRPFQRVSSTPSQLWKQGAVTTERSPLLRRHSYKGETLTNEMNPTGAPAAGGTVLGIHNLAVVLPQFLVRYV